MFKDEVTIFMVIIKLGFPYIILKTHRRLDCFIQVNCIIAATPIENTIKDCGTVSIDFKRDL